MLDNKLALRASKSLWSTRGHWSWRSTIDLTIVNNCKKGSSIIFKPFSEEIVRLIVPVIIPKAAGIVLKSEAAAFTKSDKVPKVEEKVFNTPVGTPTPGGVDTGIARRFKTSIIPLVASTELAIPSVLLCSLLIGVVRVKACSFNACVVSYIPSTSSRASFIFLVVNSFCWGVKMGWAHITSGVNNLDGSTFGLSPLKSDLMSIGNKVGSTPASSISFKPWSITLSSIFFISLSKAPELLATLTIFLNIILDCADVT